MEGGLYFLVRIRQYIVTTPVLRFLKGFYLKMLRLSFYINLLFTQMDKLSPLDVPLRDSHSAKGGTNTKDALLDTLEQL